MCLDISRKVCQCKIPVLDTSVTKTVYPNVSAYEKRPVTLASQASTCLYTHGDLPKILAPLPPVLCSGPCIFLLLPESTSSSWTTLEIKATEFHQVFYISVKTLNYIDYAIYTLIKDKPTNDCAYCILLCSMFGKKTMTNLNNYIISCLVKCIYTNMILRYPQVSIQVL